MSHIMSNPFEELHEGIKDIDWYKAQTQAEYNARVAAEQRVVALKREYMALRREDQKEFDLSLRDWKIGTAVMIFIAFVAGLLIGVIF